MEDGQPGGEGRDRGVRRGADAGRDDLCVEGRPLTIQELTAEMNRFVEAMGWYADDSPVPQTPKNIAISISLEAAEILEHFQWREQVDGPLLAEELADVALYLLQLAFLLDIDLDKAILDKLAINYERDWSAERRL
jgi:NTP pyrophosphatase (non-canonical NTP hydrolase)